MTKRTKPNRTVRTRSLVSRELAAVTGGINQQTPADWNELVGSQQKSLFNDIFISTLSDARISALKIESGTELM